MLKVIGEKGRMGMLLCAILAVMLILLPDVSRLPARRLTRIRLRQPLRIGADYKDPYGQDHITIKQ